MKKNILIFILILFCSFFGYSQTKVIKESEKCNNCGTKEQLAEVNRLDRELQELRRKIPNANGQTNGNIKALKQRIANNQRALTYINDYDLVTKCNILKTKQRAINRPALCNIQKYEVERIKGLNNKIRARIKKLESSEREQKLLEESEDIKKSIHSKKMDELDKELQALDNQLKNSSKKTSKKKSKSIDDFLADIDRKQTKKSNNNDFLADIDNKKAKGNDFLSDIDTKVDKSSFEIKYKDGKRGVVNKDGKILIPFRKWEILEYKKGMAKVQVLMESMRCRECVNTYLKKKNLIDSYMGAAAYKIGFVDKRGVFIDGYETKVYADCSITFLLTVYSSKLSKDDINRIKERKAREKEKAEKKCKVQTLAWESRMISKYRSK